MNVIYLLHRIAGLRAFPTIEKSLQLTLLQNYMKILKELI